MNYIKQINAFWEKERDFEGLDALVQSYYFACLFFANKYGWDFEVYRDDIIEKAKVSKSTYYKAREVAMKLGLVQFEEGSNKRSKCKFKVIPLYQIKDTTWDTTKDTTPPPVSQNQDTTWDHTNKLENLETTTATTPLSDSIQAKPEPQPVVYSPSGNEVKLPYPSEKFKKAWKVWLLHLSEKDAKPYTRQQERVVLDEISKYASVNEDLALKIIKYSIKGGWGKICYPKDAEEMGRIDPKPPKQQTEPVKLSRRDVDMMFGTPKEVAA